MFSLVNWLAWSKRAFPVGWNEVLPWGEGAWGLPSPSPLCVVPFSTVPSTGWWDLKHTPVPVPGRGLALPHKTAWCSLCSSTSLWSVFLFFSAKIQRLRPTTQIVGDSKELLMQGEPVCSHHRWYHLVMGLKSDINICVSSDTVTRSFCPWLNFTWNCNWKSIKLFLDKEMEAVSGCVLLVARARDAPCPLPRDLLGDLVWVSTA